MHLLIKLLYTLLRALFKSKTYLMLEIAAKDQQLAIYQRKFKRPRLKNRDRIKSGRPKTDKEIIILIKKISKENPSWGNQRIMDELKFLGIEVSLNTIKK